MSRMFYSLLMFLTGLGFLNSLGLGCGFFSIRGPLGGCAELALG